MEERNKYYIACFSKDHLETATQKGIIELEHATEKPLEKLHINDKIVVYSSKYKMTDSHSTLESFTAIGNIISDEIEEIEITANFTAYVKRIDYFLEKDVPIAPLVEKLGFIHNKSHWGFSLIRGFVEISESDYNLIYTQMSNANQG